MIGQPGIDREAGRRWRWHGWYAPVVVLVALLADYYSPAAMWTAALPLMFMAVLLINRQRAAALVVLFLSSWILVPSVAAISVAVEARSGEVSVVGIADLPATYVPSTRACSDTTFELVLPERGTRIWRTYMATRDAFARLYAEHAGWRACRGFELVRPLSPSWPRRLVTHQVVDR